mmetsp:Transcript_22820/g.45147  ORF Transcript_22820/g.45147 Transcript_22820/m.45147 type:complete len:254 (-) Transcript_22820:298-1059(-)
MAALNTCCLGVWEANASRISTLILSGVMTSSFSSHGSTTREKQHCNNNGTKLCLTILPGLFSIKVAASIDDFSLILVSMLVFIITSANIGTIALRWSKTTMDPDSTRLSKASKHTAAASSLSWETKYLTMSTMEGTTLLKLCCSCSVSRYSTKTPRARKASILTASEGSFNPLTKIPCKVAKCGLRNSPIFSAKARKRIIATSRWPWFWLSEHFKRNSRSSFQVPSLKSFWARMLMRAAILNLTTRCSSSTRR